MGWSHLHSQGSGADDADCSVLGKATSASWTEPQTL